MTSCGAKQPRFIVATHSGDVLRGILESDIDNVNIVRLTRDGTTNQVRQLDADNIRKLWPDSILRFSNVLDGLFHESVVVREGDADCRFYAAVLEAIHGRDEPQPDALFTSTGGKDRLDVVVSSLVSLGVPTRVVADFDVLRNEQPLRRIVESLGGTWDAIESDWRATKSTVEQKAPPLTKNQVKNEIEKVRDANEQTNLTDEDVDRIRKTLRATSSWDLAKQSGVDIVPTGQPRQRLNTLFASLRSLGLFVVECGELERFAPSVGGHGPRFAAEVLKRDLARDPELADARRFVADLFSTDIKQPPSNQVTDVKVTTSGGNATMSKEQPPRKNIRFHLNQIGYHLTCLLGIKR